MSRAASAAAALLLGGAALASSHREAPFVTKNPKVDGTDFYLFRSYEPGRDGYVTIVANYLPIQSTYGGPNFFKLDPNALYEIHVDNDGDAIEDLTFQFRFQNALSGGNGLALDIGPSGAKKSVAVPFINLGAVTAADMSKQNVLETYTIKLVRGDRRSGSKSDVTHATTGATVFKKPLDYVGTKSLGDAATYAAYAASFLISGLSVLMFS